MRIWCDPKYCSTNSSGLYIEGGECLLSGTVEIKVQALLMPVLDLCSAVLLASLMLLVFILFN